MEEDNSVSIAIPRMASRSVTIKVPKEPTNTAFSRASLTNFDRTNSIYKGDSTAEIVAEAAKRYGHDEHLLHSVIYVESRYNPTAVSHAGAIGLMQIMPATGERFGVVNPRYMLRDPQTNINVGARYLAVLKEMFNNDLRLVLAAYNAGEGAVIRYGRRIPPFPETQDYVRKVLARYVTLRSCASRNDCSAQALASR